MCRRETLGWKTLRSIVCSTIRRNAVGQLVMCAPVQEADRITGAACFDHPQIEQTGFGQSLFAEGLFLSFHQRIGQ
jgi:hypothetical protein